MGLLRHLFKFAVTAAFLITPTIFTAVHAGTNGSAFSITRAEWDAGENRLTVRGGGDRGQTVTVTNADTGAFIGQDDVNDGRWRVRVNNPASVPCTVSAAQSDGQVLVSAVTSAPADCDDGGGVQPPDPNPGDGDITARGDAYATPVGTPLDVAASRVSGVLYNDFGGTPPLTAELVSGPANGNLTLNSDGSFSYTPNSALADNDNDSFVYRAVDSLGSVSADTTVNINILSDQVDYKIFMNYELGMHCTGFEFAYCCVLPPYNSILAQVIRPESSSGDFPRLLEGDPHNGLDGLGRETVVRDFDRDGTFKKFYLEYYHDAQPRREGQGKNQTSTLISAVETNSLFYHQTIYDSAEVLADGSLRTGTYEGADGVVLGDGDFNDPTDNYANGWLNHFYIYQDLEGTIPAGVTSEESAKIRLGVQGHVEYPADVGAALQPMGPTGSAAGFDNVLTFSADTGTVVYTQMKVLENLPVMLTSPRIWEALGLPLTPFEDSIDFFGDPGLVDEDSIRPYVAMKARLHEANCDNAGSCTQGPAVIGSNGHPVIGFGTAPIDIPNCERCHSVPSTDGQGNPNLNSPAFVRQDFAFPHGGTFAGATLDAVTDAEYQFWLAFYDIVPAAGDADWYARLKGAAINMLALHDFDQGTGFTSNWPNGQINLPAEKAAFEQNTRLGKESVICQKCHADNVIAVVKSATQGGATIKPITEAIHWRHREISEGGSIDFADAAGRSGGCQGCHPAHRSDGVMDGYPITLGGDNEQATGDNRLAAGGCFVGRDVHSNPMKDVDGAETPAHLNAVGDWLATNVFYNQAGEAGVAGNDTRGLWCTNCHTQLGQELWKAENCVDLINGECINNPRGAATLADVANAVGVSEAQAIAWLDPNNQDLHGTGLGDFTHAIWESDPGLCQFLVDPANPAHDGKVATVEVAIAPSQTCSNDGQSSAATRAVDCTGVGGPAFDICGSVDGDGDFSVNLVAGDIGGESQSPFCTTDDCVSAAQATLASSTAVAVPFSAASDGRDHWLSPGEPHCADCHSAPYVEQSGNINPFPPFNYPRKASLMRYSRGHQDISCQGCHESIHGLYPVTPTIDSTSYAQAAALNHDGSHGPLKCGTCHEVRSDGIPTWVDDLEYNGQRVAGNFDRAVSWMHTYTAEADPREDVCLNCHGDERNDISWNNEEWTEHTMRGRTSRQAMDQAEALQEISMNDPLNTLCESCHGDERDELACDGEWRRHLTQGRVSESVWEAISRSELNSTCGW